MHLLNPLKLPVHHMTPTLQTFISAPEGSENEVKMTTLCWLSCCSLRVLYVDVVLRCVVTPLVETVPLAVAVTPLRCLPESVVTPQLLFKSDAKSHPEVNTTPPRETLKIHHPWRQACISPGSFWYVSGRESGCTCSFHLFTFIFLEKATEYI